MVEYPAEFEEKIKSGKDRYEPNEAAIQNEGASDAPESGQKKMSPKDVKKIRKIKMSFRPG